MEKDGNGSVTSTNAEQDGELDDIPVAPAAMAENIRPGDTETKPTVKTEEEADTGEVLKERHVQ